MFAGEGAQWSNFYKPGTVDDNFSLLDAMVMLIVDTILYMVIAWYVDNINPGDAGVAQPPWFLFLVSIKLLVFVKKKSRFNNF